MFTREFGRTASYFADASFRPNFLRNPRDFLPPNRTNDVLRAEELCGDIYQCQFDFAMSLNREMAHFTKNYYASAINIRAQNERYILLKMCKVCQALPNVIFSCIHFIDV